MSEETVINHPTNVCTKAKLDNRATTDAFATRLGWLDDPGLDDANADRGHAVRTSKSTGMERCPGLDGD